MNKRIHVSEDSLTHSILWLCVDSGPRGSARPPQNNKSRSLPKGLINVSTNL